VLEFVLIGPEIGTRFWQVPPLRRHDCASIYLETVVSAATPPTRQAIRWPTSKRRFPPLLTITYLSRFVNRYRNALSAICPIYLP
jgi:hypothetical protein